MSKTDEIQMLRERLAPAENERLSDDELERVIAGAKEWIAGRRWGWTVVATNYVRDGRYHAGAPRSPDRA